MAVSADEVRQYIALGREQSFVEFKSSGSRIDRAFLAKVIRGILAMANRRDGGRILVGVRETDGGLQLVGLAADQEATWTHDDLANSIAEYADPRVVFETDMLSIDGHRILVITVHEFADVPVICKRTFTDGRFATLREGAIYIRSNRKPESAEVNNFDEMRALIDLATDKEVRRFITRAQAAGMAIRHDRPAALDAERAFAAERGSL
jgi:predicted HTH transcriptional regulator